MLINHLGSNINLEITPKSWGNNFEQSIALTLPYSSRNFSFVIRIHTLKYVYITRVIVETCVSWICGWSPKRNPYISSNQFYSFRIFTLNVFKINSPRFRFRKSLSMSSVKNFVITVFLCVIILHVRFHRPH